MGLLDGAIFDVAHGLITAGNHLSYNGLGGDPVETDEGYVGRLGSATMIALWGPLPNGVSGVK